MRPFPALSLLTAIVLVVLVAPMPARGLVEEDRILLSEGCDSDASGAYVDFVDPATGQRTRTALRQHEGARVSPDGTAIAASWSGGPLVSYPDGSGARMADGVGDATLAWSPDGTQMAYLTNDGLYVGEFDSPVAPALIASGPFGFSGVNLDWSPDGTTLLVSANDVVEAVAVSDGSRTVIASGQDARYSSDGTWIAFTDANDFITKMNSDGSGVMATGQKGGVGAVFGTEVAYLSGWHVVDGVQVPYVGVYSFDDGSTRTMVDGDPLCDSNFYIWDWANLQLPTFVDTEYDDLFFEDIEWLHDAGITKGCNPPANDMFCGGGHLTRGQMAALLVRALGLPPGPPGRFVDDDGSTFEDDIDRLAAAGITRGCNPPVNDRFCPNGVVTRAEVAAFLVRAMGYVDDGGGDLFVDDDGSIFEKDIDRLATAGVTRGCNPPVNDRYCPSGLVTREQMAAMLHRALG